MFDHYVREHFEDGGVVKPPKNTVKAYKLFRTNPRKPGQLFPLFVDADTPVPIGKWIAAKAGDPGKDPTKVKSKLGDLAYRPGWHSGDLPVATHIGGKSSRDLKAPDYRPDNQVWAEVEHPDDVDWQSVANSRMEYTKDGRPKPATAHITDQVPAGGHYRYKTNPNMTGNWIISGGMKVNRVLSDDEVQSINDAAGVSDLPRLKKAGGGEVEGHIPHDDPRRARNLEKFHGKTPDAIKGGRWYHGTTKDFQKFRTGNTGAIYVSQDPNFANEFSAGTDGKDNWNDPKFVKQLSDTISGADGVAGKPYIQPNVMPVHVRAENPFDFENPDHVEAVLKRIDNSRLTDNEVAKLPYYISRGDWEIIEDPAVQDVIKDMGHDSFFVKENGVKNLGVYDPSQLKSATGNQGTFDQFNSDITKAEGGALTNDEGLTAYHGSPHDFEQFDTSKIGTGEGAQSYGHGLYFAGNEDVAKSYRDRLSGHHPGDVKIGDEEHPHWARREIANAFTKLGYDPETSVIAAHYINEHEGDIHKAHGDAWLNENVPDAVVEALLKADYAKSAGHMYEVHINAHPDHFLDWDRPIREHSEMVQNAIEQSLSYAKKNAKTPSQRFAWSSVFKRPDEFLDYTGSSIQNLLARNLGSQGASDALALHGIKGIKYLDAGSRDQTDEPTHNYVVFNHDHVNVRRKYEQGGAV
jgi:hypothetical protein